MLRLTCLWIRRQTLSCGLAWQRLAWRSRSGGSRSAGRASKKRNSPWEVGLNPIRALAFLAAAISAIAQSDTPATSAAADSSGPAILSRGEAPAAMSIPEISFRPFVEFGGVYDTGLTGVAINSNGQLGASVSPGIVLDGGVSGTHSWKHTKLGLDYHGSVYHYTKTTYYDGADQSLRLGITHEFTHHLKLALRESAGLFSRNYGLPALSPTTLYDSSASYIPSSDFYDNRTIYASSQADLTIQKTSRLSFTFGGDFFLNRRRSTALYGMTGAGARSDMQYRLSRRTTIGAGYTYTHYAYHGVFSGTDLHGVVATYGIRLTKTLEFSGYGGFMREETKFEQSVPIDPAIAALIGTSAGAVIVHNIEYVPNVSARLSQTFSRGVLYLSGGHTVTPGNGLFLTSEATTVSAGYTYTGRRHWSFGTQAAYDRAKSIGNVLGSYGDVGGTLSASRQLVHAMHAVLSFSARQYQSPSFTLYNRMIYTVRLGIGFTPGDIPLRMW